MLGEGKAGLPLPSPPRASYFSVEDTSDVFGMINSILLQPPLSPDRVGHIGWWGGEEIPGAFQKRLVQGPLVSSAGA